MEAGLHLEHPMPYLVVQNIVEGCGRVCAGCPGCRRVGLVCLPGVVAVTFAKRSANRRAALMSRRLGKMRAEEVVNVPRPTQKELDRIPVQEFRGFGEKKWF